MFFPLGGPAVFRYELKNTASTLKSFVFIRGDFRNKTGTNVLIHDPFAPILLRKWPTFCKWDVGCVKVRFVLDLESRIPILGRFIVCKIAGVLIRFCAF